MERQLNPQGAGNMWNYLESQYARAADADKQQLQRFNSMAGQLLQRAEQENQMIMGALQQQTAQLQSIQQAATQMAGTGAQYDLGLRQEELDRDRLEIAEREMSQKERAEMDTFHNIAASTQQMFDAVKDPGEPGTERRKIFDRLVRELNLKDVPPEEQQAAVFDRLMSQTREVRMPDGTVGLIHDRAENLVKGEDKTADTALRKRMRDYGEWEEGEGYIIDRDKLDKPGAMEMLREAQRLEEPITVRERRTPIERYIPSPLGMLYSAGAYLRDQDRGIQRHARPWDISRPLDRALSGEGRTLEEDAYQVMPEFAHPAPRIPDDEDRRRR